MRDPFKMAIDVLRQSVEERPDDGPLNYALAALLAINGDLDQAQLRMQRAKELGVDTGPLEAWISKRSQGRSPSRRARC